MVHCTRNCSAVLAVAPMSNVTGEGDLFVEQHLAVDNNFVGMQFEGQIRLLLEL